MKARAEAGYSLVALVAGTTIMLIFMGAAVPAWRYVMKNDREEEMIFRAGQIADAIERFRPKNGNGYPPTLKVLVEGKYLRKEYKDPMTKDGKWCFLRPDSSPGTQGAGCVCASGEVGAIAGVASRSAEKGLRLFNGRSKYCEWRFLANQPRSLYFTMEGEIRSVGKQLNQPPPGSPPPP